MKYRSVFDIIGPVMIGPSSSHTAGAARIGRMARQLFGKEPKWSLWVNDLISKLLNKLRLDNRFCCHFVLKAVRK